MDTGEKKIRETSPLTSVMPPNPEISTWDLWNINIFDINFLIYLLVITLNLAAAQGENIWQFASMLFFEMSKLPQF